MWMMGGRPGTGYSWMMANDGEATSSGSAPSSAAIALARSVLPAPRSPTRCTTASRERVGAMARPAAAVCSSVSQTNVVMKVDRSPCAILASLMAVSKGDRFGSYEILAAIGAGGMGEVFRARDVRLDRIVAMKFLPAHLHSNPQVRERFQREAKAISALNHPHICALYDIGHEQDMDFLVMEHLEGETLADRVQRGPLPLPQVMKVGAQIAGALERAHAQGIVHRDLKPSNVMLTPGGAKLLDFGLAELQEPAAGHDAPTVIPNNQPLTAEGAVLGTLNYMPPEQLEGRPVDARSDIFALGLLLYEMAAGRRAFDGTSRHTIAIAILESEPEPISNIRPVPPILEQIIGRCLAKHPDERWQSAHDVRMLLETSESGTPLLRPQKRSSSPMPWIVAATGVIAALLALLWAGFHRTSEEPITARFVVQAPPGTAIRGRAEETTFAVSPDGTRLAISATENGRRRLWIRPLDSLDAKPLEGTDDALSPLWSPDGTKIAFVAAKKLKVISADGGPPQTLTDADYGTAWSPDGTILFSRGSCVYKTGLTGGTPTLVVRALPSGEWYDAQQFLPDGKRFLVLHATPVLPDAWLEVASTNSSKIEKVTRARSIAKLVGGKLLFVRDATLLSQSFDSSTLRLTGEPVAVANDVSYFLHTGNAAFSLSSDGRVLAFQRGTSPSQLVWRDRNGRQLGTVGGPRDIGNARISPDGSRVAIALRDVRNGAADIWVTDLDRGTDSRFTNTSYSHSSLVWSPDGHTLAFAGDRVGPPDIYLRTFGSPNQVDRMLVKGNYLAAPP